MQIEDASRARRLARTIVSDIALYNKDDIKRGIMNDNLFEVLEEEIDRGRKLYASRVTPQILEETKFFDRALVDILIKHCGNIESDIW